MLDAILSVFNLNALITALNVFILFLFVGYIGSGIIGNMLSKRKNKIIADKEKARTDMEEAEKLKAEYEAKLKGIDEETKSIVGQAKETAALRERTTIDNAKEEAKRIIERANLEAQLEKKRVNDVIKNQIIDNASVVAGKVIAQGIDSKISDELIEETLNGMGESVWQS